jgi:20S proteasome alpha/beta subunit
MTCVVGITNGTRVYIGADRSASDEITIVSMCRPKVHIKNNFVFGYAGSLGTGQLMEMINFKNDYDDVYTYIRLDIVEQMKKAIESFGSTSEEHGVSFLIGREGRLFEFSTEDWSVIEVEETAVGSGGPIALGSLYTSKHFDNIEYRIDRALNAAITYAPTCSGPIDIKFV